MIKLVKFLSDSVMENIEVVHLDIRIGAPYMEIVIQLGKDGRQGEQGSGVQGLMTRKQNIPRQGNNSGHTFDNTVLNMSISLERRNTVVTKVSVVGHSIDRNEMIGIDLTCNQGL